MNFWIYTRLWSVNKLIWVITFQYPITKNEINIEPNKLKEIFSKLIEKFLFFAKNKINNNNIYNLKDIDDFLDIKIELENNNYILDTETNKNTIIHNNSLNNNNKDSFRQNENNSKQNSSKKNRKNSSKIKNHKTAMERLAETYDDLDLYIPEEDINNIKSKTQKEKKINKNENRVIKNMNYKMRNNKNIVKQNTNYLRKFIKENKNIKKQPRQNKSFTK